MFLWWIGTDRPLSSLLKGHSNFPLVRATHTRIQKYVILWWTIVKGSAAKAQGTMAIAVILRSTDLIYTQQAIRLNLSNFFFHYYKMRAPYEKRGFHCNILIVVIIQQSSLQQRIKYFVFIEDEEHNDDPTTFKLYSSKPGSNFIELPTQKISLTNNFCTAKISRKLVTNSTHNMALWLVTFLW